ncbi:MAG: hemin ABC transporter substrate-binding protein [Pikeienuella sp.]
MKRAATLILALAAGLAAPALAEPPARIATAGGALTEIVYALGHEERLVGVDATSIYPEAARALPQIGYFRQLSAEGLLALTPDLLLADPGSGPPAALSLLRDAGLEVVMAPQTATLDQIAAKIGFVGEALEDQAGGEALAADFGARLGAVRDAVARIPDRPRVLFIMTISEGAPLVGGAGTAADAMIGEAGGINAAADIPGYKPMSREALIAAAPDHVVVSSAHAARDGGIEGLAARPDIAATPAGAAGRIGVIDTMLLLGMGPRAPEGVAALARMIHSPEAISAAGL